MTANNIMGTDLYDTKELQNYMCMYISINGMSLRNKDNIFKTNKKKRQIFLTLKYK